MEYPMPKIKGKKPAGLKHIDVQMILRKRGTFLKLKQNKELKEAIKPMLEKNKKVKATEPAPRKYASFTDDVVMEYCEKQLHLVDVVEAQFENKVRQFIEKVGKDFLQHLDHEVKGQKSFAKFVKKDFFGDNEDDLLTQATADFMPLLESVAVISGNNANKLINLNTPYLPFNYRKQIADNVEKFTKSMLDTDRNHLTTIITNGLQDGKTVSEIRSQIEADFGQYSKMQSTRIAQTEIIRTSNQAALDAYEQSGVVEGKQWVTFGANDECEAYDGQIVTLSGNFYSGDNDFQDGDPPLHPNCKCVVIPIVTD
jgi:SPP1 gp7 family putative phage head morphogenesis protein